MDTLLLSNVPADATVEFCGFTMPKTRFFWGLRLFLVLVVLLVNLAIWYAWKSGRALRGRDEQIQEVRIGETEKEA